MKNELEQLIKKAQRGDREAFGKIYEIYYKKIYRYCKFNTEDEEIAQDVCQETFVKAWKGIKSFKFKKEWSIQAFLFRIARNLLVDRTRKKKIYHLNEFIQIESNENLYEGIERKYDIEKARFALKKLDEEERQIIILKFFEEMDTKQIANILHIKEGALRVRIHRTLGRLKTILEIEYERTN